MGMWLDESSFSGDFIILRCSDKSYLIQGLSKSYMCEHIWDYPCKRSLLYILTLYFTVFSEFYCRYVIQQEKCWKTSKIILASFRLKTGRNTQQQSIKNVVEHTKLQTFLPSMPLNLVVVWCVESEPVSDHSYIQIQAKTKRHLISFV